MKSATSLQARIEFAERRVEADRMRISLDLLGMREAGRRVQSTARGFVSSRRGLAALFALGGTMGGLFGSPLARRLRRGPRALRKP
jgi:hypothetical protein